MVCLDTSFLIDFMKGKVSLDKINNFKEENIFIPSPVVEEIFRGLYLNSNLKNIKRNEKEKINSFFRSFSVLGFGKKEAVKCAELEAELINKGKSIDFEDIMIASICIENKETLITKNQKHFNFIKKLETKSY